MFPRQTTHSHETQHLQPHTEHTRQGANAVYYQPNVSWNNDQRPAPLETDAEMKTRIEGHEKLIARFSNWVVLILLPATFVTSLVAAIYAGMVYNQVR